MINRFHSEEEFNKKICHIIGMYSLMGCLKLEIFLSDMNEDQLKIIASGEVSEIKQMLHNAPDPNFADVLFNHIFRG